MVKNIKWSVADFLKNSYFLDIDLDKHLEWFKTEFLRKKSYIDYFLKNEFNSKNLHKLIVFYLMFRYKDMFWSWDVVWETNLEKLAYIVSDSGDVTDVIILNKFSVIKTKINKLNKMLNKLWTTENCLKDNEFISIYFSFITDIFWLIETITIFFECYEYILDVDYTDTEIFKLLKYNKKNYERKQNNIFWD